MKTNKAIRFLLPSLLLFIATLFTACDKGSDPSAQETLQAMLENTTWKIQNVTVSGVDKTSVFSGLTLQFSATSYTTTNGNIVWPASGTWTFISEDGTQIKRDDGVDVKVGVTDSSLKLTLNWAKTTLNSGRVNSVAGEHVFTFIK